MSTHPANGLHRVAQPPTSGTQPIFTTRHRATRTAHAIRGHIAVYLGPVTAEAAVTACCRALGREPESLGLEEAPQLLAGLRPMLGTLLGGSSCRILLHRIEHELSS